MTRVIAGMLAIATCGCGSSAPRGPDGALGTADALTEGEPADGPPAPLDDGGWDGPLALATWPADGTVTVASGKNAFGINLSGLAYEPASASSGATLWAVQNQPSKIYRLIWDGSLFTPVASDGWVTGKLLHYPTGKGSPDSEGLTRTDWSTSEMYVAAERDNDTPDVARQSILRYELGGTTGIVAATHEWVLTDDMPAAVPNHGLEGIAWIPDAYLVGRGFIDESTQAPYDPSHYANHGTGVFVVGRDDMDGLAAYVLDHTGGGGYTRVASFSSGQPRSVDLTFDRDTGTLWSLCDSSCNGHLAVLDVDTDPASGTAGHFILRATVPPPKALSKMANEGVALAPVSECVDGRRSFFWADDQESGGYAIRRGWIVCGRVY